MAGYDFIDEIIKDLNCKITEIIDSRKFPLIFILIGAYPGISQIHQTPSIICEYIKDDNLAPLIISFEPYYKTKKEPLQFLTNTSDVEEMNPTGVTMEDIEENKWYYPHFIPKLKDSYKGKVGYKYLTLEIKPPTINKIVHFLATSPGIVFLWNFTSIEFPYNCHLPASKFSIPPSNCMANIKYNVEYNRFIKNTSPNEYELVNNQSMIEFYMEEFKSLINKQSDDDLSINNHHRIQFLKGVIVNYIKTWIEWFRDIYIWENKVRLTDYRKLVTLSISSLNEDWFHYIYRSNMSDIITKLKKQFMSSNFQYFVEFLNHEIYTKTMMLITFDSYIFLDEKLTSNMRVTEEPPTNVKIDKEEIDYQFHIYYSKQIYDFNTDFKNNYNAGINCKKYDLPNIISTILQKYNNSDMII